MNKHQIVRNAAFLAMLFAGFSQGAPPDQSRLAVGRIQLQLFDYRGVTLDDGPLRRQFDEIRDYYLRIPNDDLLKGFRQRAGLPAPGVDLGGWYTRDFFHIFGQILSGLSRMYTATGDPACREKVDALIREWTKTISPDGYFYYTNKPNAPHYTYEKMVGGLVDAYVYADNREALTHLSQITDWAIKNLTRARPFGFNSAEGDTEWYTLTENLYRAYLATGDTKYRDFGAVWEYTQYWDLYARKADIFSPFGSDQPFRAYHAYSHVNTLSGAGAAYLVKGEPHYLDTLKNAYDFLTTNEIFATGGFGPNERLMPPENNPATLQRLGFHFETQCGTWAVYKLGKYLLSITGDAAYADWIERVTINGIGASIPSVPDGNVFYFSDYNINGGTKRCANAWSCCAGTRPMAAADFHDIVYLKDADNLYVALFTNASVNWTHQGAKVKLSQRTRFPEEDRTEFIVSAERPTTFGLKVRVPGWLAGPMQASLNGSPIRLAADDRHWASISREWRNGDRLSISLPAKFWLSSPRGSGSYPAAVMWGPVTLAFRSDNGNPSKKVAFDALDRNFVPSPGEPLAFHLHEDPSVLVRPFYEFKQGENYFMYLHPRLDEWLKPWSFTTGKDWESTPWYSTADKVGASTEYAFEGTGIRWHGFRFQDGGTAEVTIDGKAVGVVDQYGAAQLPASPPVGPALPFDWAYKRLAAGKHTLKIQTLSEKNEASKGHRITIAGFEPVEN
jgi:DUF1680 family protein